MKDARKNNGSIFKKKRPLRVIAFITLWSFIFTNICGEFLLERAWAATLRQAQGDPEYHKGGPESNRRARTPLELTRVGSNRAGGLGLLKEFNVETFNLPQYLGHIKDTWTPLRRTRDEGRRTIIHLQDAHCNYDAQHKIADIIEYLNREYGVNTVNLEGGKGNYDLSIFTDIQDTHIREKVADYFVKEGLINGAEYFAINNADKVTLWGVEETNLYLENLNIYRESLRHKEEIDKHLKSISHILSNLKRHIYTDELLELDLKYGQYKANNIEFKDYLTYLIKKAQQKAIDIKSFTNIYLLHQALIQEEKIDFKIANIERDKLIDRLQNILSKNELEELVVKTVEFKKERISQKEFYEYLAKKAKSINVQIENFPELHKYIIYISLYDAIDKSRITAEIDGLEVAIKEMLYENDKQRELNILSKTLALMKNLFNAMLTREDYEYYKKNEDSFNIRNYVIFINKEVPLYKITAKLDDNITNLDYYREDMARFYKCSFERDKAFLENIYESRVTILVTGGFHTENLSDLFKKNNISYVSIMPNFKNGDGYESPYFNLLADMPNSVISKIRPVLGYTLAIASFLSDPELCRGAHCALSEIVNRLLVRWRESEGGLVLKVNGKTLSLNAEGEAIEEAHLTKDYRLIVAEDIDDLAKMLKIKLAERPMPPSHETTSELGEEKPPTLTLPKTQEKFGHLHPLLTGWIAAITEFFKSLRPIHFVREHGSTGRIYRSIGIGLMWTAMLSAIILTLVLTQGDMSLAYSIPTSIEAAFQPILQHTESIILLRTYLNSHR